LGLGNAAFLPNPKSAIGVQNLKKVPFYYNESLSSI
jgi:hypothetical protein